MTTLSKDLRRQLERTAAEARKIAEVGAEQSLHRLAVELPRAHDALNDEEKKLRVSLRAHAKQLGDRLDERPMHLIQAVAYEHWHQLLFARFLIENDLLLHPEHGVALSLDEVKQIALDQERPWVDVASDFAQRMLLRSVFQPDDPALRVSLPPEKRLLLEEKLTSLPREVFLADDSLGWVYQFWQRDEKERVNKSETKIGADELPAVTQLFTEDYMVLFLLENTLGAWWTAKRRAEGKGTRLPGYDWAYLRLNEDGSPAAGLFEAWPRSARELRVLDPCMGSGHFLVFALPILTRMRMEEEHLSHRDALAAVLRDNLFGLEIDNRCAQIAAFNLALAAWRLAGGHFALPEMNLACSGLGINAKQEDWLTLAGDDTRARETMRNLYHLFQKAPVLGSLIDPKRADETLFAADFEKIRPLLQGALRQEQGDYATRELAVTAQGLVRAAQILTETFALVITNVPYLSNRKQCDDLKKFCTANYRDAKNDLAVTFLLRLTELCREGGSLALVMSQYWLFTSSYSGVRDKLLKDLEWPILAKLGVGAFEMISGEIVNVVAGVWNRSKAKDTSSIAGLDVTSFASPKAKAEALQNEGISRLSQTAQRENSKSRIVFGKTSKSATLEAMAVAPQGVKTGDDNRWRVCMWEIDTSDPRWLPYQTTVRDHCLYGGRHLFLDWRTRGEGMVRPRIKNRAVGKRGVAVSQSGNLPVTLYTGERFDSNIAPIIPADPTTIPALWAYCSSEEYHSNVRLIDQSLKVSNIPLVQVPFDVAHWRRVAEEKYTEGLPTPQSDDPTQWLFNGYPKGSDYPLQVAVARLVGYRWPRQTGSNFLDCSSLAPDGLEAHADGDGIVPLNSLGGKTSAADRLRALLAEAYGNEWSAATLSKLLDDSDSLEGWLREHFFDEHCKLFYQRPFVWHIWDGRKDGFHVFVNYHALDHKTLEKLIYSTLGDWISRQRQDIANDVEGADGRLVAAEHLQNELKNILHGESPYDVFVRWKPLKEQPIGWNPDLNDGIRLNIRPWISAAKVYGSTKPGVLRVTPNIKFGKDQGKEPSRDPKDFPWFKDSRDRNNDIHLTLEEKRNARGIS